ncbi:MAG: hypothetical protein JW757_09815 [Anaerolineales bacterium]|nr:hypothetical protein [Anaerolineales bacterium]
MAKIPYRSPHKIRNGHGVYAVKQAKNIEEFKAYSQNMMHENMQITDSLYGRLSRDDIKAVITAEKNVKSDNREALFNEFIEWLESKK